MDYEEIEGGYRYRCDWCKRVVEEKCSEGRSDPHNCPCDGCVKFRESLEPFRYWEHLFTEPDTGRRYYPRGRLPNDFPQETCKDCDIKLTPFVLKFADIWLTQIHTQRLQRAINEQRKQR